MRLLADFNDEHVLSHNSNGLVSKESSVLAVHTPYIRLPKKVSLHNVTVSKHY